MALAFRGKVCAVLLSVSMVLALGGCGTMSRNQYIAATTIAGSTAGAVISGVVAHRPIIGVIIGAGAGFFVGHLTAPPALPDLSYYGVQYVKLNGRLIILVPTNSLFAINSVDFKPNAAYILRQLADYLRNFSNMNIHISGNTSAAFSDHKLFTKGTISIRRAAKVAGYFWHKKVDRGCPYRKLTYSSNGANYPIATNGQISGMMANERMQIVVYPEGLTPYPEGTPPHTKVYCWQGNPPSPKLTEGKDWGVK